MKTALSTILTAALLVTVPAHAGKKDCNSMLTTSGISEPVASDPEFEDKLTSELTYECGGNVCSTDAVVKSLDKSLPYSKFFQGKGKSAIAVTAVLIGSATAVTAVSQYVGADYPQLAEGIKYLMSPIATMGLYVFGAPIWEPLVSAFRNKSFRANDTPVAMSEKTDDLEQQFFKTNSALSRNAQQMRAIIALYTRNLTTQTDKIRRALEKADKDDPDYQHAVGRMAEVLSRFKLLYPDIDPHNELLLDAVRVSFETIKLKRRNRFARDVAARVMENARRPGADYKPTLEDVQKILADWLDIHGEQI